MSLTSYIDNFLHFLKKEQNKSDHTIINYKVDLLDFVKYMESEYSIDDWTLLNADHFRAYFVHLVKNKKVPTTIRRRKSSLQSMYKWMLANKLISQNIIKNIPTPKLPSRIPIHLEPKAVEDLMTNQEQITNSENWQAYNEMLISTLLFETGMRRAELTTLTEKSIDFNRAIISVVGKGNKMRQIPIRKETLRLLQEYIVEKNKIFAPNHTFLVTPSGLDVYPQYIYRAVQKMLSTISNLKKRSPHVLRHTFATQLLNNGADIKAIQDLLGHSSLAATQIYTHTNIEELKKEFRKSHPRN